MGDVGQPPHVREDGDMGPSDEKGGPNPCLEDDEFHKASDADSTEEAIGKFMEGLEGQGRAGFSHFTGCFNAFQCQCIRISALVPQYDTCRGHRRRFPPQYE
jgi:hypothetical protein